MQSASTTQIRLGAPAEGAIFVDVYAAMLPDVNTLIGVDGLHPTEAGYQRIAETFFAAIRDLRGPLTGGRCRPMPAPALVVDVRGVSQAFGGRVALEQSVAAGRRRRIVALLGPNGAGKTTTLRILAGLIAPTRGGGVVAGVPLDGGSLQGLRARVGLLTETPGLWDRLTVRDQPADLRAALRRGRRRRRGCARARPARPGGPGRRRCGVLSKGLRQRVALARALLRRAGGAAARRADLGSRSRGRPRRARRRRRARRARGAAVLLSTHQLDEAEALADRIAVLQQTLLAVDTPAGLRARLAGTGPRRHRRSTASADQWRGALAGVAASVDASGDTLAVTLAAGRDVPDAVAALVTAGARVRGVRDAGSSLEDAYLALVRRDG